MASPLVQELPAVVLARTTEEYRLSGRTIRSLTEAGFVARVSETVDEADGPVLLAKAGSWLRSASVLPVPRQAEFIGIIAEDSNDWSAEWRRCGGEIRWRRWWQRRLPSVYMLVLGDPGRWKKRFQSFAHDWTKTAASLSVDRDSRTVILPGVMADFCTSLRVLQVVTTIQIGGAERIVLDLAAELNRQGVNTAVAALGLPTRRALPEPEYFFDLSDCERSSESRAEAITRAASIWGADLLHAHLLSSGDLAALEKKGVPTVVSVHNAAAGWPSGMQQVHPILFLACAQSVEEELLKSGVSGPVRTLWNGIVPSQFAPSAQRIAAGQEIRRLLALPDAAKLLLSLANPRPQKRLDLLPPILAELRRQGMNAHLVLAGEPSAGKEGIIESLRADFAHHGLEAFVHWRGAEVAVAELLAACDAVVSTSAWEGLSLAHLETLAAGKPVIATDVGGTREIAQRHGGLHLVPPDLGPVEFSRVVASTLAVQECRDTFPNCFTRHTMAKRAKWLYPRVLPSKAKIPALWLVANNFSTGGAQSSARRLLIELAKMGYPVRAATVQEAPDRATPGRRALEKQGIPVLALPPPELVPAEVACARLLEEIDDSSSTSLVFWNLIPSYKLLLADALLHARIFDVSPGGMLYTSMEKYFLQPRADLPWTSPRQYGRRLAAFIVKYQGEVHQAAQTFGAPVKVIPNGVPIDSPRTSGKGNAADNLDGPSVPRN